MRFWGLDGRDGHDVVEVVEIVGYGESGAAAADLERLSWRSGRLKLLGLWLGFRRPRHLAITVVEHEVAREGDGEMGAFRLHCVGVVARSVAGQLGMAQRD